MANIFNPACFHWGTGGRGLKADQLICDNAQGRVLPMDGNAEVLY